MDIKCSLLNDSLDEEVYVSQPVGFDKEGQESKVYKLHKALYGLKKSPKYWNKKIDGFLRDIWFLKYASKHGAYVRRNINNELIIICLYLVDLLITGSSEKEIYEFKLDLMKEIEMNDICHVSYFLGIFFYKGTRGILMHQIRYASEKYSRDLIWIMEILH